MPKEYESKASIAVAAPTLSPELLKGVSSLDATERQRAIQQHLLSAGVLERVVREEQLNPKKSTDEMVTWLRRRVDVKVPVPIGVNPRAVERGIESFDLFFKDSSPERTVRVTNRLADVFVEENSRRTTQRAAQRVGVTRFDGLDRGLQIAGMADHITIGIIADDGVVFTAEDRFLEFLG